MRVDDSVSLETRSDCQATTYGQELVNDLKSSNLFDGVLSHPDGLRDDGDVASLERKSVSTEI